MIIGIPREIKEHEYRVSVTPSGARALAEEGNHVIVEHSAGKGSGFEDEEYRKAGAHITDKGKLFDESELIVKVKEPVPSEFAYFKNAQALFTFLHLAANPGLIDMLLEKRISGFAYETLEAGGALPLLMPMSEIAGKMAPIVGAYYLQKVYGGEGVLVAGASDADPAEFLILGAGAVGTGAIEVAVGIGANVTVINKGKERLKKINDKYHGKVRTLTSTGENIERESLKADVLIGAVYVTGARAPKLVSREIVSKMKKGSVIVDVSVDQGGCVETTKPTTHSDPIYTVDGVIHYTVANMPGAYPRTATQALTGKTLEYIKNLAAMGIDRAATEDPLFISALNTYNGRIMHSALEEYNV